MFVSPFYETIILHTLYYGILNAFYGALTWTLSFKLEVNSRSCECLQQPCKNEIEDSLSFIYN